MAKNLSREAAIKAWNTGKPIQAQARLAEWWIDVRPLSEVLNQNLPMPSFAFDEKVVYRLTPEPVEFTLYVYVNDQGQRIVLDYALTSTTYKLVVQQKLSYTPG